MSEIHESHAVPPSPPPGPAPLTVLPVHYPRRLRKPSPAGVVLRLLFWLLFAGSLLFNFILLLIVVGLGAGRNGGSLSERYHSGKKTATDKVAIIRVEGVILEGLTDYPRKQIDQAAQDQDVKAVVLRINSPGGSITACDDLHQRILELRDGSSSKHRPGKPLVVSMGAMAASGGYYIAMPAKNLVAERTTITGSIGVYASFPNFTDLGKKYGFYMNTIKAGEVKDSGSMFHPMTAPEREVWQESINHAFAQFMAVVEAGRPKLKGKLREVIIDRAIPNRDPEGNPIPDKRGQPESVQYIRRRADGGIFTSEQAKKFGLVDKIGYLDDAIAEAKRLAGLGEDYKAITYERPQSLLGNLLGVQAPQPDAGALEPSQLASGVSPRLWYLAPQSELAGLLAATSRK